jgi:Tfp pilus assembly protein PilN
MNIDINLLPKELRAKPLVDTRTLVLIVLVLALAVGCFFAYHAKSSAQAENASIQNRTEAMVQEASSISSNPEAIQLYNSIGQLRSAQQDYSSYRASLVGWGDALTRLYNLVPGSVIIKSIVQTPATGNILVVQGGTTEWSGVNEFVGRLDLDPGFKLLSLPTFDATSGTFTLAIGVAPGGGR